MVGAIVFGLAVVAFFLGVEAFHAWRDRAIERAMRQEIVQRRR